MGTLQLGERCKHGLYCNCYICNFENEIERLKKENDYLRQFLKDTGTTEQAQAEKGFKTKEDPR